MDDLINFPNGYISHNFRNRWGDSSPATGQESADRHGDKAQFRQTACDRCIRPEEADDVSRWPCAYRRRTKGALGEGKEGRDITQPPAVVHFGSLT
jgi:hypothetical protein